MTQLDTGLGRRDVEDGKPMDGSREPVTIKRPMSIF